MERVYLNIPVDQWELYVEHVVQKIYGISDFTITNEGPSVKRIEFIVDPVIPLINSMPVTLYTKPPPLIVEPAVLDQVTNLIRRIILDYEHQQGRFHTHVGRIMLPSTHLQPLIHELDHLGVIDKFLLLSGDRYLIALQKPTLIRLITSPSSTLDLKRNALVLMFKIMPGRSVLGELMVTVCDSEILHYAFDVDDGYFGTGIMELDSVWKIWKDRDDVTLPIHPPNII